MSIPHPTNIFYMMISLLLVLETCLISTMFMIQDCPLTKRETSISVDTLSESDRGFGPNSESFIIMLVLLKLKQKIVKRVHERHNYIDPLVTDSKKVLIQKLKCNTKIIGWFGSNFKLYVSFCFCLSSLTDVGQTPPLCKLS